MFEKTKMRRNPPIIRHTSVRMKIMRTAKSASKNMPKVIDKKQQSSLVAIKPVSDACLLFYKRPVPLAELNSLTTKSSSFSPEALTGHE